MWPNNWYNAICIEVLLCVRRQYKVLFSASRKRV
uniref:Uncharacterized protein n=1 Tax=Anopheles minimus TaxID=112268 RepID=A0A182WQC3_9DIPT